MLVMTAAFGIIGALVSTPLTAFIKAYCEEFYLAGKSPAGIKEQVEQVLERKF